MSLYKATYKKPAVRPFLAKKQPLILPTGKVVSLLSSTIKEDLCEIKNILCDS